MNHYHGLDPELMESQRRMGIDPLTQQWQPGWGPSGFSAWRALVERYGFWMRVGGWAFSLVLAIILVIIRGFLP